MRKFSILLLVLVVLLVGGCSSSNESPTPTPVLTPTPASTPAPTPVHTPTPTQTGGKTMQWPNPPQMTIDQNKQYTATMKTNYGDIVIELLPKEAPLAVNNFVFLAREGFYDDVIFHRVVTGFVIQSGDPTGTGRGGPGYKFADEVVTRDYIAGTLAMANSGPNTNGSQFFITLVNLTGKLQKNYTIFGLVSSGFDVVQSIGNVPVKANPMTGEMSVPTVDVHIITVSIEEK